MSRVTTDRQLRRENLAFQYTGGVSQNNARRGFSPAFRNPETGDVYRALTANGAPAPYHCLDGLPECIVAERHDNGRVKSVNCSLESGFLLDEQFFTREQAASVVASDH